MKANLAKAAVLDQPQTEFSLIETLRWTPRKGYFLLEEHLTRLLASAEYFDITIDELTMAFGLSIRPFRLRGTAPA